MKNQEDSQWFPMRSTYGRELKVKDCLDSLGINNYVPMTYQFIETKGERHRMLVPAVHNLIFVRSSMTALRNLKSVNLQLSSLRFMTRKSVMDKDRRAEIITVPDVQMDNFIKATKDHEEDVTYLNSEGCTIGEKVKIVDGIFSGVEGHIKRIQKNKRVVVCISDVSSVMLNFVPSIFIEKADEKKSDRDTVCSIV